ncbi:MAG TPA: hypothetical protein VNR37_01190 [Microbacteriaceae bacterium]|nr:hypothetical protein [Microbacteriaceae bacterium]
MTTLRLIAPFRVDFTMLPGAADRDPEGYRTLWERAESALAGSSLARLGGIHLPHRSSRGTGSQYDLLDVDSLERTLHVAEIHVDLASYREFADPELSERTRTMSVLLFEHGVALLEIDLDPGPRPSDAGAHATQHWLDELQADGIRIAEAAASRLSECMVVPLAETLRRIDRRHEIVRAAETQSDDGSAMWVSRALLVAPEDRVLLDHWTRGAVNAADRSARQELIEGDRDSLVRWLNYAFVDTDNRDGAALTHGRFAAEWRGLRYAQAMYASLDRIDSRLSRVLALAAAAQQRWQLEALRRDLVELSNRAEMIVMQRHALAKYLPREVRASFDEILAAWEYGSLLEDPVRFKVDLCNRRLDDLAAKRTARAGVVTDLILLGIGVTSIASIALAITEFGRNSGGDPGATAYDLGASGITTWFATQPIDVILMASGVASLVLVALYLYFRRDDRG